MTDSGQARIVMRKLYESTNSHQRRKPAFEKICKAAGKPRYLHM